MSGLSSVQSAVMLVCLGIKPEAHQVFNLRISLNSWGLIWGELTLFLRAV